MDENPEFLVMVNDVALSGRFGDPSFEIAVIDDAILHESCAVRLKAVIVNQQNNPDFAMNAAFILFNGTTRFWPRVRLEDARMFPDPESVNANSFRVQAILRNVTPPIVTGTPVDPATFDNDDKPDV